MALQNASPKSLVVVFTDNGSKDLMLERDIVRLRKTKEIEVGSWPDNILIFQHLVLSQPVFCSLQYLHRAGVHRADPGLRGAPQRTKPASFQQDGQGMFHVPTTLIVLANKEIIIREGISKLPILLSGSFDWGFRV